MKKQLFIVLLSTILISNKFKAQDNTFDEGSVVFTAGLGFPDFNRTDIRSYYNKSSSLSVSGFGPTILKLDYGVKKLDWGHTIGLGFVLGYNSTKTVFQYERWWNNGNNFNGYYGYYTQTDRYRTITLGGRVTYHFYTKNKIDLYGNMGLGYHINMHSRTTNDPNGYAYGRYGYSSFYYSLTAGIRYYFTENFGLYSELGWDMSTPIQLGVSLKF